MLLEKFAELHRARIEHYLNLAKTSIDDAERLGRMQWDSAKVSIEKNTEIAKAMSETQDISELFRLSKELTDFKIEEAWSYPLSIYQKTVEIQAELSRLMEESLTAYGVVIAQTIESDSAVNFSTGELKAVVEASETVFAQLDRTANEAANIADAGFNMALAAKNSAELRHNAAAK